MFHQATPSAPAPAPTHQVDDPAQLRALCKNFLREGMELSHRILEGAQAGTAKEADAASRSYERVARAMHRTILLLNRLDNPPRKSSARKNTPRDAERPEPVDTIDRPEPYENDRGPEIGNQPTPDVIAAIQRDLDHVQKSHPPAAIPQPQPPPEPQSATAPSPASAGDGRAEGASQKSQPPNPPKHSPDG